MNALPEVTLKAFQIFALSSYSHSHSYAVVITSRFITDIRISGENEPRSCLECSLLEEEAEELRSSERKKKTGLQRAESGNECTFSCSTPCLINPKPADALPRSCEQPGLARDGKGQVLPEPPYSLLALNQVL